jgi:ABC-2 type transport system permease protein
MIDRLTKGIKTSMAIAWFYGVQNIRRSPFSVVNFILTPVSILFFIYLFGGARATTYGVVGGLVSILVSSSIIIETDAAFIRIILKVQDMFVASPASAVSYAAGLAVAELINGIAGVGLFIGLLAYYHPLSPLAVLVIAYACTLTWVSITGLGFLISSFARDPRDLWVYSPILTVMLSFVPPVFYPLTTIPSSFRLVAFLSPTTYAAELVRDAVGLSNSSVPLVSIGLLGYSLLLIMVAAKRTKWMER